jgi:hypothetical protein
MYAGNREAAMARKGCGGRALITSGRYVVGDERRVTGFVLARDNVAGAHRRMGSDYCGDFRGLDAKAPDLDLRVVAAEVFKIALSVPPNKIPAAEHDFLRSLWVWHEALGRVLRAIEVSP